MSNTIKLPRVTLISRAELLRSINLTDSRLDKKESIFYVKSIF